MLKVQHNNIGTGIFVRFNVTSSEFELVFAQ